LRLAASSRQINLFFNAPGAVQMMISDTADFVGVNWIKYQSFYLWTLSEGDEAKIIYVKFRDNNSAVSAVKTLSINLTGHGFKQKAETPTAWSQS